ncbi:hypothetical protein TNCV_3071081 [Trichonephila clavipes]|nr:hypothetical protein TNCV_3071081 [Trichonephila clavipes]
MDVRDSSLGAVRHLSGGSDHEDLWGAEEMTSSRCRVQQSRCRKFPSSREKKHCNWSRRSRRSDCISAVLVVRGRPLITTLMGRSCLGGGFGSQLGKKNGFLPETR